jgi:hypothetical protein
MASEVSAHGHLALLPLDLRKAEYPVRKGMVKDAVHLIIAGKGRGEEEERKRERETDRQKRAGVPISFSRAHLQ